MRKFGVFAATIFFSILIGGLYGIINDQITFSISPEYFTKFKFRQFGFEPAWFGGSRQTVAVIGFLATWWMGLIIGFVIASVGLVFTNHVTMRKTIIKAIIMALITAIVFAFAGFLWGKCRLLSTGVNWWMPDDLVDKNNFIVVGSIHNFSYIGGIAGLLIAMAYMIMKKTLIKTD